MPQKIHILLRSLIILFFIILTGRASMYTAEAVYTVKDGQSSLEIENIDIAPTNTPTQPNISKPIQMTPKISPRTTPVLLPSRIIPSQPSPTPKAFFSVALSQATIDFGVIDATNPVIRTSDIAVTPGNGQSFSLFAYENHPLLHENKQTMIPDSTCDDGVCNESISSVWENTLTYGFGMQCSNEDDPTVCAQGFSEKQHYKQFADISKSESASSIVNPFFRGETARARITYKVNTPGTQSPGTYSNAVVFIAAPAL